MSTYKNFKDARDYQKTWRAKNREKLRAKYKEYYWKHREESFAKTSKWKKDNPERWAIIVKSFWDRHSRIEYDKKRYQKNYTRMKEEAKKKYFRDKDKDVYLRRMFRRSFSLNKNEIPEELYQVYKNYIKLKRMLKNGKTKKVFKEC